MKLQERWAEDQPTFTPDKKVRTSGDSRIDLLAKKRYKKEKP